MKRLKAFVYSLVMAVVISGLIFLPESLLAAGQQFEFLMNQVRYASGALNGGKVYFYEAGTTTLKPVYTNIAATDNAANPYTLDANGTAMLYGNGTYRVVIKTAALVTVYDRDNVKVEDLFTGLTDSSYGTTIRPGNIIGDGTDRISGFSFGSASYTDNGSFNNLIVKNSPYVDVRAWGFKTDNTAALNVTAWNANIAAGMKVLVPAGTFLVNSTLNMPDNVEITGMGMGVTEIRNTATVRTQLLRNSDTTNGNQNIYVHDLKLSCTALPVVAEAGNWHELLLFTNGGGAGSAGKNIRVERVYFYSSATPADTGHKVLHFRGMQDYTVRDCRFEVDGDAMITASMGTGAQVNAYATIQGNKFFTWGTTYIGSCIVITSNHVDVIGNHGLGTTQLSQFIEVGDTVQWVNIIGNTFQTTYSGFVIALAARDMVISNNIVYATSTTAGQRSAIGLTSSAAGNNYVQRIKIANNLMYNGAIILSQSDATGLTTDIQITGNQIYQSNMDGGAISITGAGTKRDIVVERNQVGYSDKVGFHFNGPFTYLRVANNVSYNNGQIADGSYNHGFFFEGLTGGPFYIENNLAYDNQASATQKWGFETSGSPTIDTFTGNKARGNTTASLVSGSATYLTKYGNKWAASGAMNGRATLSSGTVTVSTAEVLTADSISLTRVVGGGTGRGHSLEVGTIVAGTSFVINSVDNAAAVVTTDNSVVYWEIRH